MSDNAPAGSGISASGNGTGIPSASDSVDVAALVNEAVNKALGARLKRIDLEGQITRAVEAALAKTPSSSAPQQSHEQSNTPVGDSADQGKISMKALQDQFEKERKARQDLEKRLAEEGQKAKDARQRAEVERRLSAKLGADHPMLGPLMDSLYDVKKRFVEQDGKLGVRFKSEWGDDFDVKPLDEGVEELFKNEYKSLVSQSKVSQMPTTGGGKGQQWTPTRAPSPPSNVFDRMNPMQREHYQQMAIHKPDQAQEYVQSLEKTFAARDAAALADQSAVAQK